MKTVPLGSSGLQVSNICLGTMTWGRQNTQADADAQIDRALDVGINFLDTAEMYAVPPTADTYGKTEAIIGDWLARNPSRREQIVLASKISGPGAPWIRDGLPPNRARVMAAIDASLSRLKTDYIDLYQIHWPNRTSPHFTKHWPCRVDVTAPDYEAETAAMLDILQGLDDGVKAGKIRHCGLSDDTPWGIATYLQLAQDHNLPRMVSIQNEFSLLMAKDWPYLIEHCVAENVAYLPWSPLATGVLTGKYADGTRAPGTRWSLLDAGAQGRNTPHVNAAVDAYVGVAQKHGITPAQLALAWVANVKGVASTIIGATSVPQLDENIAAFDIAWTDELATDVLDVFKRFPVPF